MKIIGLDVGEKRIGVAKADSSVKIAVPETTIEVDGHEFDAISRLSRIAGTDFFVIGLPRNNSGEETAQSAYVKKFAEELKKHLPSAKIRFQDESLTSVEAESRLKAKKSYKKDRKLFQKSEVDAEAATIILQDFLESFTNRSEPDANSAGFPKPKTNKKGFSMKKLATILTTIIAVFIVSGLLAYIWYSSSLTPVYSSGCPEEISDDSAPECQPVVFTIDQGDTPRAIADALAETGLIKNSFAFQIHAQLSGEAREYQAGQYSFNKGMSASDISLKIARGEVDSNVFSFTMTPGTNIIQLKKLLVKAGFPETEVEAAFSKNYNDSILNSRPADVSSLEGYLYPDTYEFYKDATVEEVIETMLAQMAKVIKDHNFQQKFEKQGLTLHEGLTLASIVEEESVRGEYANVARVFLNRLENGMTLGSDVTAKYAADLLDPDREIYTDNSLVLEIDSPYNTRKYPGLTPGPIANPSLEALEGVASPAENDYLFFLTGDDGLMYYSTTESGHNQNAANHCQELCNISL